VTGTLLAIMALGYSGLVLFWLAHALKKIWPPVRAALTGFAISVAVHSVTLLYLDSEHRLTALALWGAPHLLILPLLLWSAWKQEKGA
jgi:hypothetical protein